MNTSDYVKSHPIFNPSEFYIETPPVNRLRDVLTQWIWCGSSGGVVFGESGAGKTTAIQAIVREGILSRTGEIIPVFHLTTPKRDGNTIAAVYKNIVSTLSISTSYRPSSDDMVKPIIFYLADRAHECNSSYITLIVDEFQRMNDCQLSVFSELHDKLRLLNINLGVFPVGNLAESLSIMESLVKDRNSAIEGRFFKNHHIFTGLSNEMELKSCLNEYDRLRYPIDGPTYTEMFVPELYGKGFRISSMSKDIWRIMSYEYMKPLKIKSLPMRYFISFARILLLDYLPNTNNSRKNIEDDLIRASIDACGIESDLAQLIEQFSQSGNR